MNPQSLRIGNYLKNDGVVVQIDGRSIFDIWSYPESGKYEPIPITEEWLERLGFKLMEPSEYTLDTYERYGVKLWNKEGDFRRLVFEYTQIEIKYIHQLQNLVYALSGN